MPEIAALAGLERLDMMLNDSMYGILFRDINPIRTFVDQRFSRQVHARAGIIINTGEDNYLTTADAVEAAHTVTTSQLLNEYFAKEAGLEDWQLGLGHAFEIDPDVPDSFRLELAHAMLARELFPEGAAEVDAADPAHDRRRLPRLPARRLLQPGRRAHRPGHPAGRDDDRGRGDAVALRPRPGAAERPLRDERRRQPARGLPPGARTASSTAAPAQVLGESIDLLEDIATDHDDAGLLDAIADGTFGLMKRPADTGRGLDGVARKAADYYNPATEILEEDARLERPGPQSRPPVRRHHRRRHGAAVLHAADAALQGRRGRRRSSWPTRWAWTPPWSCTASRWATDFTFFVVYGRVNHLVDPDKVEVVERDYPLLTPKEANAAIKRSLRRRLVVVGGCIGTDAHTVGIDAILNIKGFAGEKGLEYYREIKVVNLGAQVSRARSSSSARDRREGRRRPGLPGRHPARRPPAQHPRDVGGVPRGLPGRPSGRCWSSAARASTRRWPTSSASTASSAAARRPARSPPSSSTASPTTEGRHDRRTDRPVGTTVIHRRYVPVLPRPLRRQPRRRRLLPRPLRRRRHRDVHPARRRRGPVRVVLRRPVPRPRSAPATCSRSPRRWSGSAPAARVMDFAVHVVARGAATADAPGAAAVLDPPVVATTATGTVVVPPAGPDATDRLGVSRARHAERAVEISSPDLWVCRPRADLRFRAFAQVSGRLTRSRRPRQGSTVRPCRSWRADRRPSGRSDGVKPASEPTCPRRSVSHREGGHGGACGSVDNFPLPAAGRSWVGPKGQRAPRPLQASSRGRWPRRIACAPCCSAASPPLLGGVVLSLAFEPVGLAVLMPVGAGRPRPRRPRAAGPPGRWLPRLALRRRLHVRPAVLDAGGRHRTPGWRWRSSRPLYFAPAGRGRWRWCAGCAAWPVWAACAWVAVETWRGGLALRRDALGPAGLRHRRHAVWQPALP